MATSMCDVRLRLNLEEVSVNRDFISCKYWYLLDKTNIRTIEDIAHDVIGKFSLWDTVSRLQIYLNDYLLPPWESIQILRDNDEIRFSHFKDQVLTSRSEKNKKRKKKHQKNDQKGNVVGLLQNQINTDVVYNSAKKRKVDFELYEGSSLKVDEKSATRSILRKELPSLQSKGKLSITSGTKSHKPATSLHSKKCQEETSDSSSESEDTLLNFSTNNTITQPKTNLADKGLAAKKVSETSSGSSSSSSDDNSKCENKNPPDKNIIKLSPKSQVNKLCKYEKKQDSESSESSSSSEDDQISTVNKKQILNSSVDQSENLPPNIIKEIKDSSKSDSSSDSEENTPTVDSHTEKKLENNQNVVADCSKPNFIVGAQVGEKKTRKRRSRKRCRPKKKLQTTSKDDDKMYVPALYDNQHYTTVSPCDNNIVAITPVVVKADNYQKSLLDNESTETMEIDSNNFHFGNNSRNVSFGNNMNNRSCTDQSHFNNEQGSTSVEYYNDDGRDKSLNLAADVYEGVQVYTRNKKMHKKRSSFPFSEAKALSNMVSHKSFVFKENDGSGDELVMTPKVEQNNSLQTLKTPASDPVQPPPRDYSVLSALHGPPRIGDKIAYKILEMSENYCPGISDYKEAIVKGYDPSSQTLELEVLVAKDKKTPGRFDCVVEDEEEILTNMKGEIGSVVTLHWNSLMDTKLIA